MDDFSFFFEFAARVRVLICIGWRNFCERVEFYNDDVTGGGLLLRERGGKNICLCKCARGGVHNVCVC